MGACRFNGDKLLDRYMGAQLVAGILEVQGIVVQRKNTERMRFWLTNTAVDTCLAKESDWRRMPAANSVRVLISNGLWQESVLPLLPEPKERHSRIRPIINLYKGSKEL